MLKIIIKPGQHGLDITNMIKNRMQDDLFRQNAVNHLNMLEAGEVALQIVCPKLWMWLLAIFSMMTGILIWIFFGRITFQVEMQGIILSSKMMREAEKVIAQGMRDRKEKVRLLRDIYHKKRALYDRNYLSLSELTRIRDDYLTARLSFYSEGERYANLYGRPFSPLSAHDNNDLVVLAYVHYDWGKQIRPQMNAYLLPAFQSPLKHGYLHGKVISVSNYPVTKQIATIFLGNRQLAESFFNHGAPFLVVIGLDARSALQKGTWMRGKIVYQACTPAQYVIYHMSCQTW